MKLIDTLKGHNGCIKALSGFSYFDSNYLISGSSDSTVKLWNQTSNEPLYQLETSHTDSIQALAYNQRLHYLAIGSKDTKFSLWKRSDEYEGINLKTIRVGKSVYALAILPNSNIVSSNQDYTINIWRSESPFDCIANLTLLMFSFL